MNLSGKLVPTAFFTGDGNSEGKIITGDEVEEGSTIGVIVIVGVWLCGDSADNVITVVGDAVLVAFCVELASIEGVGVKWVLLKNETNEESKRITTTIIPAMIVAFHKRPF